MDLNNLSNNPEDVRKLISLLQSLLPEEAASAKPARKKQNKSIKAKKSTKKQPEFNNKFLLMSEANMHKDDTLIDKKLAKFPPTPRSRQFSNIEVRCRSCGKTEMVNPVLVHDRERYKCNRCSASK